MSSSPVAAESRYLNRELAWLEFNSRVLDQADDARVHLLERAKFLAITASNLDEFVMVRVGSLKLQGQGSSGRRDPAGLTASEQLQAVATRCHRHVGRQYKILLDDLQPQLAEHRITRVDLDQCSERLRAVAERHFRGDVVAVLSPQALHDRRFPMLPGLGIHLCVQLRGVAELAPQNMPQILPAHEPSSDPQSDDEEPQFAVIPLGRTLPRIVPLPIDKQATDPAMDVSSDGDPDAHESSFSYVLLEDLVSHFVDEFFPGREVVQCKPFRITRNADVELREDGAGDLLGGMEEVLESRRLSDVVRLEMDASASDEIRNYLMESFYVDPDYVFRTEGPLDLTYLFGLHGVKGFDALRDEAWPPQRSPAVDPAEPMFSSIAAGDIMLMHPYETFDPVVRLIEEAATDPDVLAVKQILYRTSRDSPIVAALKRAAERGKYVTAIVELKARFDEARNIEWAREMEQSGVQVIYGIRGLKTHAKVCIIVRREPQGLVRYMHFGTGNYNEVTANLYGDVSLLTKDETFGTDATMFFNAVTGSSHPQPLQQLAIAPLTLRRTILELIRGETERSRQGQKAHIMVKLNALVDMEVIDTLYEASQAGVKIQLNVRGVCCLRPGIAGLSESIEVVSIVDRFLEHARVFYFRHGGDPQIFISSADWMPRNLDRRIELLVPVNDPAIRRRLRETLQLYFRDNQNAWAMQSDGAYERVVPGKKQKPIRSQESLYRKAVKTLQDIQEKQQSTQSRFETHRPRE
ncbi:polyphosphate kinase 1 [Allorhodopirellula heiligendammensis]|uniref:Polyphosphate kinase n=1 Tax=Allorhodopirellula heiligendammensis TaxID=2714739 RepID=A0A5C6BDY7_9BACT|nr:polyphosphate kinase 1 [Allorhodopirellula heiligendammensis]TWU10180.1 Polyphosphate kinase [Allorhodopirellula heiligendammensis]